ncbi:hypothetical protein Salat_1680900 [Sesamum alatum]|uniref:Uncharacterized protein n=1 Tax=Sesamum alatum TaxID=300844 RepID=A0AAE1Y868_9LAMI|nr:hypothetical protein Salat_1680900 [Sesamum alatum]
MEEPLHLLEAFRRLLVSECMEPKKHRPCLTCKWLCCFRVEQEPRPCPPINQSTGGDLETGLDQQNTADLACRLGPTTNANPATGVRSTTSSIYNKFLCCSTVQETHSNLETITTSSIQNKFLCCSKVQETHGNTTSSIYNKFLCCSTVQETQSYQATNTNMNTSVDPRTPANEPRSNPLIDIGPPTRAGQATNRCYHLSNFLSRIRVHKGVIREGSKVDQERDIRRYVHSFRSATDLTAKGIYFKPSSSQSLKDAKFKSSLVYAQLELPTWGVSIYTKVFFLNMLAYEMSPNNVNNGVVTSYINLMKSLIESTEDVKELREKKILYNMLGSDEQVRDVYKEIKTYGNPPVFHDLQEKIQAHYNSKMKTWIAELIHTHFRTPWTVIGLLAAISLLAIASVNVYFSAHRKSNN